MFEKTCKTTNVMLHCTYASILIEKAWTGHSHAGGKSKKKGFVSKKQCQMQKKLSKAILPQMMFQTNYSGFFAGKKTTPPHFPENKTVATFSDSNRPFESTPFQRQFYVGCTKKLTVKRKVVDTSESAPWSLKRVRFVRSHVFVREKSWVETHGAFFR